MIKLLKDKNEVQSGFWVKLSIQEKLTESESFTVVGKGNMFASSVLSQKVIALIPFNSILLI